jgi:hypothetical protein
MFLGTFVSIGFHAAHRNKATLLRNHNRICVITEEYYPTR